ncbi:MAG: response regulator transcription factor [Saccharofermentanales bacterium]
MPKQTILVVDDERKITEVLASYLENSGFMVVCAFSGIEAIRSFESCSPSLILLDLMLPDMSGEDICRTIRKKSSVPVIMLTAKVEEEDILKGLAIGADDYITKPFSPRQVVARVQAVLRRAIPVSGSTVNVLSIAGGSLMIDNLQHKVSVYGEDIDLTPNEFKILFTLASYPNKTFTREELIMSALGADFEGFDRAVDSHIKNIRQKIEPEPRTPKFIITIHGIGYRIGGESIES